MKTRLAFLALMMTALGASSVAHAGSNPWRTNATPSSSVKPSVPGAFPTYRFVPDVRAGAPAQQADPATPYWQMPRPVRGQQPFVNGQPYGGFNPYGMPGQNGMPGGFGGMPYGNSGSNGLFGGNNNLNGLTGPMSWFPFW